MITIGYPSSKKLFSVDANETGSWIGRRRKSKEREWLRKIWHPTTNLVENPWGLTDPVLTWEWLGFQHKLFLAQLVNAEVFTTFLLGQRFCLSAQHVIKHVKDVREGNLMHGESGRPPMVDKIGLDQIETGLIALRPNPHGWRSTEGTSLYSSPRDFNERRMISWSSIPLVSPDSQEFRKKSSNPNHPAVTKGPEETQTLVRER